MATAILNDAEKMKVVDKYGMLNFCVNSAKHYREAAQIAKKITVNYPKPDNVIIAGMGGSGISGDLLKDWVRNKTDVPIEVNRGYELPKYAGKKTLVVIMSHSGDTEESLSAFLDALRRKCMIFCISSGGVLLKYAEKLHVPFVRVVGGMPPRAALPYMFVPLLFFMEKIGLVSGVGEEFDEALSLLEKISSENSADGSIRGNFTKTLAVHIGKTVPVTYGFGFYRGVAKRFKQQFNENSKLPSKSEVFPELNHNEIVGWEGTGELGKCFSVIFIRDQDESVETKSRIETTKQILKQEGLRMFEIQAQGKSKLARMLSTIIIGDFTSVYLALLQGVDPTPIKTINHLKDALKEVGVKEKVISELEKL